MDLLLQLCLILCPAERRVREIHMLSWPGRITAFCFSIIAAGYNGKSNPRKHLYIFLRLYPVCRILRPVIVAVHNGYIAYDKTCRAPAALLKFCPNMVIDRGRLELFWIVNDRPMRIQRIFFVPAAVCSKQCENHHFSPFLKQSETI